MYARSLLIHVAASTQLGENAGAVLGSTFIPGFSFLVINADFSLPTHH